MSKHIYNLKLSPIHNRTKFRIPKHINVADVPDTDVSKSIPFTYDQGQLGSCVYNAGGMNAAHVDFVQNNTPFIPLARLAPYYQYRAGCNAIEQDTGSSGYDACGVYKEFGIGPESLNPYDITKFDQPPTAEYLETATKNELLSFQQIPVDDPSEALNQIRAALHSNNYGVMIGIKVPSSFEDQDVADSGEFMSLPWFPHYLGGHEVYVVGSYRNGVSTPFFRILNSWGDQWGKAGLNGIRGFVDISEKVLAKILIEANVMMKMES